MEFTKEETTDIKTMLRFLIEKKHKTSGGHCGFHLNELQPLLDEMVKKGEITKRDTIHCNKYFLNNSKL